MFNEIPKLENSNTQEDIKESEARDVLVKKLGTMLHDEWRATYKNEEGGYTEHNRKTIDPIWIERHGSDTIDTANTAYEDLPADWKDDNQKSAEVTIDLIEAAVEEERPLDDAFLDEASAALHEAWLDRNRHRAQEEQNKPYAELPESEKEKDRVIIRKGIELYQQDAG